MTQRLMNNHCFVFGLLHQSCSNFKASDSTSTRTGHNLYVFPDLKAVGVWDGAKFHNNITWNEIKGPSGVDTSTTTVMGLTARHVDNITYVYDYRANAPMVPGNAYTASVWAKTSKSGTGAGPEGPVYVQAYTCQNNPHDFGRIWTRTLPIAKADGINGWKLLEFEIENRPGSQCNSLSFYISGLPSSERIWLAAPALVSRFSNFVSDKCGAPPSLPCPPSRTSPNLMRQVSFKDDSEWKTSEYNKNIKWDAVEGPKGADTVASPVLSFTTRCSGNAAEDKTSAKSSVCRSVYPDGLVSTSYIYSYAGDSDVEAGNTYTVSIFAKATNSKTTTPVKIRP